MRAIAVRKRFEPSRSDGAGSKSGAARVLLIGLLLLQSGFARAADGDQPAASAAEEGHAENAASGAPARGKRARDRYARRFTGRWAMLQVIVTESDLPVVGKIYATTRVVTLFDLGYERQRLSGKGSLCLMEIDSGTSMVDTVLPAAFVRSLPRPVIDASLRQRGDRWLFGQKRQTILVGARLKDPLRDPLPTREGDSRVFDQDRDGKPGVTIHVDGIVQGDIYVVQRNWTALSGELEAPGRFKGRIVFGNEQHILGATSWFLKHPPGVKPTPERSLFHLVRVGSKTGCSEALGLFNLAKKNGG